MRMYDYLKVVNKETGRTLNSKTPFSMLTKSGHINKNKTRGDGDAVYRAEMQKVAENWSKAGIEAIVVPKGE